MIEVIDMKKMLFIMNPFAGVKRANRHLADILLTFTQAGYEVITHMTLGRGDATAVAREKGKDVDLVVCCGGDGTLNETITGLLSAGADTPIGYIPAGSTNDFAASLKIPTNILKAAQAIVEGEPVSYDVGRFGDRYFSYVASFGAFTRSSYATPQNVKNALGHTAYVLSGITELSQIRNEHVKMEIDGQTVEGDFLFGAICNSTSVGGILTLDPKQVDMGDGLFEILLVRAPENLGEIHECIQALQSQKYNCAMLTFRSAQKVRIFADPEMPWTLDGEFGGSHTQVDIENCHEALNLYLKSTRNEGNRLSGLSPLINKKEN